MKKGLCLLAVAIPLAIAALAAGRAAVAQQPRAASVAPVASVAAVAPGDLQRSYQADRYAELAPSGAARGESLYFFKCFACHNSYAKGGPPLAPLFRTGKTAAGGVANDETVANAIRLGSATMPAYRYALSDADITDLLAYLKTADCCYEAQEPPANPHYAAARSSWPVSSTLRGGARGEVRDTAGTALEGIRVQLIAPNGVRTTVFSDAAGAYEFPTLQAGEYLLRVATPLYYEPFQREGVQVRGSDALPGIVLKRLPSPSPASLAGALPATPGIAAQLSGAELLWNLPGSNEEKTAFVKSCGIGCHDLKEVLRNRFDESSWRTIVAWMTTRGSGSVFVVRPPPSPLSPDAEVVVRWLSRVRGPDSKPDDPYRAFPRPAGVSSNVVMTEFELPRQFLSIHHVVGDRKGGIWYSSHRTPYVGRLDSRTGIVKEYRIPDVPGGFPGTYRAMVDPKGIVWFSQNWAHRLTSLDPATGEIRQRVIDSKAPLNVATFGDFAMAPDGAIWSQSENNSIVRIDRDSGAIVERRTLPKNPPGAEDLVSRDGRFWASGSPTIGFNSATMMDIRTGQFYEANSGDFPSSPARGDFDRKGNVWFGGHSGAIVEMVNEIDAGKGVRLRTFTPPLPYYPYSQFYQALPDRTGDVWTGWLHGRAYLRFDPAKANWRAYETVEPTAFSRDMWIDDSTTPVTVWYADYQFGVLVRMQPRD